MFTYTYQQLIDVIADPADKQKFIEALSDLVAVCPPELEAYKRTIVMPDDQDVRVAVEALMKLTPAQRAMLNATIVGAGSAPVAP